MKIVIRSLMPIYLLMTPIMSHAFSFCVINNITSNKFTPDINATILLVPHPSTQPIKMAELDYISNVSKYKKVCYQVTSPIPYSSTDTNSAIKFNVVATPGGQFSMSLSCQALYPNTWGYPQYAVAKINGNADTHGPYTCTTCATNSDSCDP